MRIKRYVSKNGVNTCPPILEYKIINAPKFSAVITPFLNYFSQFSNQSPNLNNLGLILLQIPRISQPLNQISALYALIGNITVRENCRWADQAILYSEISSKSWLLAVKSPAQPLDYCANSYHIYLNTLEFHGCGKRDKSDLPLPVLSYKYFLLRYSFSILSFYSPKSTFLVAALPENSKNFSKNFLHQSSKPSIFFLARKWPSTSSFLRSVDHPSSFRTFVVLLFIRDSFYWIPSFFSFSSFILKTFRIWPIRL